MKTSSPRLLSLQNAAQLVALATASFPMVSASPLLQRAVNDDDYCSFYGCGLGTGARAGIIAGIIICVLILAALVAGIRRRRIQRMHDAIYMQQSYNQTNNAPGNPYAAYPPNQRQQNQWYAGPPPGTPPAEDAPYVPPYGYKPEGNPGSTTPYYNPPQGPPPPATSNSYAPPTSPPPGEPVASPSSPAPRTESTYPPANGSNNEPSTAPSGTPSFPSMPEPAVHATHTGGGSLQNQNTGAAPSVVPSVPPPAYDTATNGKRSSNI